MNQDLSTVFMTAILFGITLGVTLVLGFVGLNKLLNMKDNRKKQRLNDAAAREKLIYENLNNRIDLFQREWNQSIQNANDRMRRIEDRFNKAMEKQGISEWNQPKETGDPEAVTPDRNVSASHSDTPAYARRTGGTH